MARFRQKPIIPPVIEAEQWWPGAQIDGVIRREEYPVPSRDGGIAFVLPPRDVIETPQGDATLNPGDWIITGVRGERYLCNPDVFAVTYEPE